MFTEEIGISTLAYKSCATITLQCLADSEIASWTTAFNRQIHNAKNLGQMPDDIKVIRATMSDFGFVMQSTQVEGLRVRDVLYKLGSFNTGAHIFIQIVDYKHCGGNMLALRVQENKYRLINTMQQDVSISFDRFLSEHVWIRWDDLVDRSPFPRRTVNRSRNRTSHGKSYAETECFKPFQPNPCNNYIGDCVVRALAGALDIPWAESIDLLASLSETTVNAREVYPKVLERKGYYRHKPITRNGHRLIGKDFCEEMSRVFHNGERIFAHVGRSHAAAIIPVSEDNSRFNYKIVDSWDSSKRTIGDFWVGPANSKERESIHGHHHDTVFHVGESLHHPSFGAGTIVAITSGILTVEFNTSGVRRLGEAWVRDNCSAKRNGVNRDEAERE